MRLRFLLVGAAVVASFCLYDVALSWLPRATNTLAGTLRPRTAEAWIGDLQNVTDPTRRVRAVDALSQYGERIVPKIVPCLRHPESVIRSAACLALARLGPTADAAVPDLLALVREPAEAARLSAIEALASIGNGAAPVIAELASAACERDPVIRRGAILALGRLGEPAAPALLGLLDQPDVETQRSVVRSLGQASTNSTLVCQALAPRASDADPHVRQAVFAALASQGPVATESLTGLMLAGDPNIRVQAAIALCRMQASAQRAVPGLLDALHDEDANVRFWALRALSQLELREIPDWDRLTVALDDPNPDVRWQAHQTIAQTGLVVHQRVDHPHQ